MWRPHSCSLWKGIQVGWIDFLLLHLLGWGMEKELGFGMMSAAEICLGRSCTLSYILLQWIRMLQCIHSLCLERLIVAGIEIFIH